MSTMHPGRGLFTSQHQLCAFWSRFCFSMRLWMHQLRQTLTRYTPYGMNTRNLNCYIFPRFRTSKFLRFNHLQRMFDASHSCIHCQWWIAWNLWYWRRLDQQYDSKKAAGWCKMRVLVTNNTFSKTFYTYFHIFNCRHPKLHVCVYRDHLPILPMHAT